MTQVQPISNESIKSESEELPEQHLSKGLCRIARFFIIGSIISVFSSREARSRISPAGVVGMSH